MLRGESTVNGAALTIPVAGLDCGISAMNRHLREALLADASPTIEFHLDPAGVTPTGTVSADVRLRGRLAIAGVEHPVTLTGTAVRGAAGAVHVRGTHDMRVTDYGVQPPRRFLGLLRVREQVTVHFDIVLGRDG